ncbi:hypothetical protein AB0O14_19685 [Microbacterium foliorum]
MFSFEKYIASERFAPYQRAHTSVQQQRELYLWNIELSQELNKTIGHAEIFLREAIDQQLRSWNLNQPVVPGLIQDQTGRSLHRQDPRRRTSGGSEEWLKHPSRKISNLILSKRGHRFVSEYDSAFTRAQKDLNARVLSHPRHGAAVTHDDVLAHITLGTWKRLLPDGRLNTTARLNRDQVRTKNSQLDLWVQALSHAFPYERNPYVVSYRLTQIHVARNRVAHHESLLNMQVRQVHRATVRLVGAIDPQLGSWLANESQVIECWKRRP